MRHYHSQNRTSVLRHPSHKHRAKNATGVVNGARLVIRTHFFRWFDFRPRTIEWFRARLTLLLQQRIAPPSSLTWSVAPFAEFLPGRRRDAP